MSICDKIVMGKGGGMMKIVREDHNDGHDNVHDDRIANDHLKHNNNKPDVDIISIINLTWDSVDGRLRDVISRAEVVAKGDGWRGGDPIDMGDSKAVAW